VRLLHEQAKIHASVDDPDPPRHARRLPGHSAFRGQRRSLAGTGCPGAGTNIGSGGAGSIGHLDCGTLGAGGRSLPAGAVIGSASPGEDVMRAIDDVLVVGAGLAGMTLATALKRSGRRPEVIEIHPRFDVLGVGISVQGPALRVLKSIGLIDQCVQDGFGYSQVVGLPRFDGQG
jgi:FAD binding domain